jgi:hypothetical protein
VFEIINAVITNMYTNLTNIVVRVSDGTEEGKRDALLVNSHYDTTVTTPGKR